MSFKKTQLFKDSFYFLVTNFKTFLIVSVLTSSVIIELHNCIIMQFIHDTYHNSYFIKDNNNFINSTNTFFLKIKFYSIIIFILRTILRSVYNTILIGTILSTIYLICKEKYCSFFSVSEKSISILIPLFFLQILTNTLIKFGTLLYIIPGVILKLLLLLSPVILLHNKKNILNSIKESLILSKSHILFIFFTHILFCYIKNYVSLLTSEFLSNFCHSNNISLLINHSIKNFSFILLYILLYRFYLLKKEEIKLKKND